MSDLDENKNDEGHISLSWSISGRQRLAYFLGAVSFLVIVVPILLKALK